MGAPDTLPTSRRSIPIMPESPHAASAHLRAPALEKLWNASLAASLTKPEYFALLGYSPHAGQRRIHASTKRFTIAVCGRRWGKTVAAAREAGFAAMKPGARIFIVAPYHALCSRVFEHVWNDLVVTLRMPVAAKSRSDMMLELPWGARIEGKTADHPDSLVGEGLDLVVFDEAAKAKAGVWERYLAPSLMDKRGRALFITTPEGMNWLYGLYMQGGKRGRRDWCCFNSPSQANPHLHRAEIRRMARNMSRFHQAQEIGAEFTRCASLVYPAFSHATHVRPQSYDPRLPLYRAIDFGYTNPFACLTIQVGPGDEVRVLDEIFERGMTVYEYAQQMQLSLEPYFARFRDYWLHGGHMRHVSSPLSLKTNNQKPITAWTHPLTGAPRFPQNAVEFAQGVTHFCDPAGAGDRAHLRNLGLIVLARPSPVNYGIELIRHALEGGGGEGGNGTGGGVGGSISCGGASRLFVDPRCVNLIREFSSYHYATSGEAASSSAYPSSLTPYPSQAEAPVKEDDHALDALRYFMANMY